MTHQKLVSEYNWQLLYCSFFFLPRPHFSRAHVLSLKTEKLSKHSFEAA